MNNQYAPFTTNERTAAIIETIDRTNAGDRFETTDDELTLIATTIDHLQADEPDVSAAWLDTQAAAYTHAATTARIHTLTQKLTANQLAWDYLEEQHNGIWVESRSSDATYYEINDDGTVSRYNIITTEYIEWPRLTDELIDHIADDAAPIHIVATDTPIEQP